MFIRFSCAFSRLFRECFLCCALRAVLILCNLNWCYQFSSIWSMTIFLMFTVLAQYNSRFSFLANFSFACSSYVLSRCCSNFALAWTRQMQLSSHISSRTALLWYRAFSLNCASARISLYFIGSQQSIWNPRQECHCIPNRYLRWICCSLFCSQWKWTLSTTLFAVSTIAIRSSRNEDLRCHGKQGNMDF